MGQKLNAIQTQQLELYKAVKETLDRVLKPHLEPAVLLTHFRRSVLDPRLVDRYDPSAASLGGSESLVVHSERLRLLRSLLHGLTELRGFTAAQRFGGGVGAV